MPAVTFTLCSNFMKNCVVEAAIGFVSAMAISASTNVVSSMKKKTESVHPNPFIRS